MFYSGKIIAFLVAEAVFVLIFAAYGIVNYVRFRKVYSDKGRLSSSDIGIAVIVLNTVLYLMLVKSFPGYISTLVKGLIAGLLFAWGIFSYIVLFNGQRVCDSCGMKGFKSGKPISRDLCWAALVVAVWSLTYGKLIKPALLHRPTLSFTGINTPLTWQAFFMPVIMYCIIMPINEEILFRHGIMTSLMELLKGHEKKVTATVSTISVALTSVIFSMAHLQDHYLLKIMQILPIAVTLAVIYKRQNLWQSILIHVFFNLTNYLF